MNNYKTRGRNIIPTPLQHDSRKKCERQGIDKDNNGRSEKEQRQSKGQVLLESNVDRRGSDGFGDDDCKGHKGGEAHRLEPAAQQGQRKGRR